MSKSRHTEVQIISALKQVEAGCTVEDVAREQGLSKHTIYAWKANKGGMEVGEAEEVKHLRDENGRLKELVAGLSLDKCYRQLKFGSSAHLVILPKRAASAQNGFSSGDVPDQADEKPNAGSRCRRSDAA